MLRASLGVGWGMGVVLVGAALAAEPATKPVTSGPAAFEVLGYQLEGSTLLKEAEIQQTTAPYTGPKVDLGQIRQALAALQTAFREHGYPTIGLQLPPQQLTNGVVHVQITEGRLAEIQIHGNRHFSTANIRRALPSLTTNILLNTHWFQPELDRANGNSDRQIYPVIGPGPDPGTSALTLNVKDRLPLHGHVEINNRSTPGTPPLRIESAIQYNNLWQREHQAGFQYNFSPQEAKQGSVPIPRFLEFPRVSSYSGFYQLPFGQGNGARDEFENAPSAFGYDPITRKFVPPTLSGNRDFIVYASRSASETRLNQGPLQVITNTVLADISSRLVTQDVTGNNNLGTRVTWPLPEWAGIRSSVSFGLDYKDYSARNYRTNLTYFDLYALDEFGNRQLVRSETIPLDANGGNSLAYAPLAWTWSASRADRSGFTAGSFGQSAVFSPLASDRDRFVRVAGSTNVSANYTILTASLFREQRLPRDWSLQFRLNGQWASSPLISNEQFGLGGTSGVRGYQEGEEYGDAGWRFQLEPKSRPFRIGQISTETGSIPITLRATAFLDYGERYLLDAPQGRAGTERMLGSGAGALLNVGQALEARLMVAFALLDTPASPIGSARAYFSLGFQF